MKKDRTRIIIDSTELQDLMKFASDHKHSNVVILETSGGSGIGTNLYVICGKCLEERDITDYGSW